MELEFLDIGEYQFKENYLQHIHEMNNIKLEVGDTYNSLFEKLRNHFESSPEKLEAVNRWIKMNEDDHEDKSLFDTIICGEKECYASFNIYP